MKTIKFVLLLILYTAILNAQEDQKATQSLRAGLSSAFFGSGDMNGFGLHVEYTYSFSKYLAVAPRIMSANAAGISEFTAFTNDFHQISSFGISLAAKCTPFPNTFKRLSFDLGGLYHKFHETWGDVGSKDEYNTFSTSNTSYYEDHLWGFIGSASLHIIDGKKYVCGLRFDLLTSLYEGYLECDGFQTGVFFGLKL